MALLVFISLVALAAAHPTRAAAMSALERAIMELPPEAVADIPTGERRIFLNELRRDAPPNKRLDIKNGFLEFYSDGEVPFHVTSMLYIKVFPLIEGGSIILCHMPKPESDSLPSRLRQTFIFTRRKSGWIDLTGQILPKGVYALWRFQPRRASAVIEVGPYKGARRKIFDLIWDGTAFRTQKAKNSEYSYDSL